MNVYFCRCFNVLSLFFRRSCLLCFCWLYPSVVELQVLVSIDVLLIRIRISARSDPLWTSSLMAARCPIHETQRGVFACLEERLRRCSSTVGRRWRGPGASSLGPRITILWRLLIYLNLLPFVFLFRNSFALFLCPLLYRKFHILFRWFRLFCLCMLIGSTLSSCMRSLV